MMMSRTPALEAAEDLLQQCFPDMKFELIEMTRDSGSTCWGLRARQDINGRPYECALLVEQCFHEQQEIFEKICQLIHTAFFNARTTVHK
jgi:hypothetical protein